MSNQKFQHNFLTVPKIEQKNLAEGRKYVGEGFAFPSITTVLSKTKDNTHLFAWKKRVGEEQAQKITTAAATRGTKMHTLCEKYLLNEEIGELGYSQGELLFRTIRPHLDRVEVVRALETGLFSKRLQVAGTVDCVAEIEGVLTVVDFKTSSREKKKEWIEDYFMQGAFYLNAFYELSGELPKAVSIMIALETGDMQIFDLGGREIIHYSKQLEERIEKYYADQAN